ncbi:HAD-IA family hydrolase [Lichenicoccus sp.]|uniref:HAD-IA family hydrolase n=1 Tax=Lichenicoccus sp. TaxID=2781899 RepID=UPI003D13EBBC
MRAVIFDLDGTLVDSAPDIAWAINRMLAVRGLPAQEVRAIERLTGEGAHALVAKLYEHLGHVVDHGRVVRDTAIYLAYYRQRPAEESTLYADAAATVPALHAAGLGLAVCTNKAQSLAEAVLRHFGIAHLFDIVVGSDTTPHRKPHPAPLQHALAHLGVAAGDALFIGDTVIDRDTALAAGIDFRVVGWGNGPLVQVSAAQRLQRFADLLPQAGPD